jgi:hypothetical protein
MGKSMDSVDGAVDRVDLVHRGPTAIVASPSLSELGLRLLQWSRLPDEGRRRKREARGLGSRLTEAQKVVDRRCDDGEGGGGGALGVGSLEVRREGKEERMLGQPFIGSEGE